MAGKKREIQLQAVINTQSQWEEMLQNKGLTVIDVYQAWCGPCKAMQALFRKLKNELNEDEILHFAVAEADNIVTLQPFRDKCEPIFLFSVNGKIIAKIEGANAPLVNQKIINLINEERKIAAGEMVRPQYREISFADSDIENAGETSHTGDQRYMIAIIKPEAMSTGKTMEIKEKIVRAGFVVEAEDKRVLTEMQVRDFYSALAHQPDFEDFVPLMTNGLSCVLVLSRGNKQEPPLEETVSDPEAGFKEPSEDEHEMATPAVKKQHQGSLQECLEIQTISQFCDVEENIDNVNKFIDIFFPDFKSNASRKLERILALLRPDLVRGKREDVLNIIQDEDFIILMQRQIVLSEEEAQTLCKEYENQDYFENLIENMISGPSLALVLLRDNGLQHWKNLIGPSTVEEAKEYFPERFAVSGVGGQYPMHHHLWDVPDGNELNWNALEFFVPAAGLCVQFATEILPINQLYGSESLEAAAREIQYFFPPQNTLALIKPHATHEQREEIFKLIKEAGFDITRMKEMLLTEEQADKIYFKIKNKNFYKDVLEVLSEGPSVVMSLTKWNAVSDWRRLMGPTDPEEAKLLSPDSIRARFGRSILTNVVHGSSNDYEAMETINRIFEEFSPENPEEN